MGRSIERLRRPAADNTANSFMNQVLGNKHDAAITSGSTTATAMAYLKGLLGSVGSTQGPPAMEYFVDGNVSVTGDGTMGSPYKTFAEAVAASNISIALTANRWWARRNIIYLVGDDLEEDIVAIPEKCDVIGCGSSDLYSKACIRGNHVPVNAKMGCRFFNVRFRPAASEDLWILDSTTGGGLEFHECNFDAHYAAFVAPSALDITASQYMKIIGCEFYGNFSADYIDIGAGRIDQMEIAYNKMYGSADNGLMVTGAATIAQGRRGSIHDNFIQCADIALDTQAASVFNVYNNTLISGEAFGASSYVIDLTFASNNMITAADTSYVVPDISTN